MRTMRRGMDAGRERKEPVLSGVPEPDRARQAKDDTKEGMEKERSDNMTNKTMELLARVFVAQILMDKRDAILLLAMADALSKFRASGKPADEEELRQAAEIYIKEISRRVLDAEIREEETK